MGLVCSAYCDKNLHDNIRYFFVSASTYISLDGTYFSRILLDIPAF